MHQQPVADVHIVRAFADAGRGGNPAGVVLDADGFSPEEKQRIAARVGLSETAFVSRSDTADIKLEFFTPNRPIAQCGHATVAAFALLKQGGRIAGERLSMENTDGIRKVFLSGERVFMEQRAPQYTGINAERQEILQALGLQSDDLLTDLPVVRIDTGNAFAIVPTAHAAVLNRVRPDMAAIEQISERHDLIGLYVFALGSAAPGRDATTRMFAPRYGIPEESATGVASGQLACYLHDIMRLPQQRFLIEQGHFMAVPTPSLIQTDVVADMGKIVSVMAGGTGQYELTRQVSLVP